MRWAVAVLAAGQGTRMRSNLPKVLHELAGRPLLDHVLNVALQVADPEQVVVVIGHRADRVAAWVSGRQVRAVVQEPQLGTGDALRVALAAIDVAAVDGIVVLSGDVPLLTAATVRGLMAELEQGAAAVLLTAELADGGSYGRVVRDPSGRVRAVVEARDADPAVRAVREVNAGIYAFRRTAVEPVLARLAPDNAQGEYYLTDVVAALREQDQEVAARILDDANEMRGVNTRAELAAVARVLNRRVLAVLMDEGVTVLDPDTTWVAPESSIGRDAVLEPGVIVRGRSRIGEGARIGAYAVLDGVEIEADEVVPPLTHRGRA
jgi:bifunctional UDP-N-acetylglucosamine pyrophosphorylase/glucosamine-1-phosphate N-acetyltransferase